MSPATVSFWPTAWVRGRWTVRTVRYRPYKLRTVHEREEGVTPQSEMRKGQKVTQAILIGTDLVLYFTGEIIAAPVGVEFDRGCRTKIT